MSDRPRVAVLGFIHESNSFNRVPTGLDAFTFEAGGAFAAGDDLWEHTAPGARMAGHEIAGLLRGANEWAEAVPLYFADALPGGPVEHEAFESLWRNTSDGLRQGDPFDGILVALHGAAVGAEIDDLDGEFLSRLRSTVGPVPIVATLDCHANLSPKMVEATDAILAYRTNPHVDHRQTGERAADLLRRMLLEDVRPTQALVQLPLVLSIDRQASSERPCSDWLAIGDDLRRQVGVLDVNLLLGYPWADVHEMGVSVHVLHDGQQAEAQQAADQWATAIWQDREQARSQAVDVVSAMAHVRSASGTVGLLDLGDNIGAGSRGDSTALAQALLDAGIDESFVPLADKQAFDQLCHIECGSSIDLKVGGNAETPPLHVTGRFDRIYDGQWHDPEPRHGGRVLYDEGPLAVVRSNDGLTLQISPRPIFPASLGQVTCCDLNPEAFHAIVLKGAVAPRTAYAPVCTTMLACDTAGPTAAGLHHFTYAKRRRPLFPLDG
jgi:microcystin degradation protein MlrC